MSDIERAAAVRPPLPLDVLAEPKAYAHYRRLFAGALAKLAASGFAAPPDEGVDLIHGFFAELWNQVAPRHDPMRGAFDSYMHGCFVNYARPRIVRLRRMRGMLVEPGLIESALAATPTLAAQMEALDLAAVRRAVSRLQPVARAILRLYLDDDAPSERDLAATFGLTRYAIRMQLSDAIGEVMVELGDLAAVSDTDRSIARSLFGDRRSVRETARFLRREIAEIQDARTRWLGLLVQAVKGNRSMETKRHAPSPIREPGELPAAELLMAALRSDAGGAADAAIRQHRESIWRFLDEPAAERLLAPHAENDPTRLARVYDLLADETGDAGPLDGGEYDLFLGTRETEAKLIGEAFRVLMNGLDGEVARPWKYFQGLKEVDSEIFAQLREDRSVGIAEGFAIDLARFGITPVVIANASLSLSSLAHRFCRQNGIEAGGSLVFEGRGSTRPAADHPVLRREDAIDNLALGIELPRDVLDRLYDWLIDAASFAPLFFEDFEAYGWEGGLTLIRTDRPEPELLKRWYAVAPAEASSYGYA